MKCSLGFYRGFQHSLPSRWMLFFMFDLHVDMYRFSPYIIRVLVILLFKAKLLFFCILDSITSFSDFFNILIFQWFSLASWETLLSFQSFYSSILKVLKSQRFGKHTLSCLVFSTTDKNLKSSIYSWSHCLYQLALT